MTVNRIEGATEKTETLRPTDAIDRISLDTMNGELGPCFTRKGLREALADGGRIVTDQAVYIEGDDTAPPTRKCVECGAPERIDKSMGVAVSNLAPYSSVCIHCMTALRGQSDPKEVR